MSRKNRRTFCIAAAKSVGTSGGSRYLAEALERRVLLSQLSFQVATEYGTGSSPYSVTSGDFNGDGNTDLAATNYGGTVSVLLNSGNGTFATKTDYDTGYGSNSVIAADFNGDGKADLAVANNGSNTVSVLPGNGDGTFAAKADYETGSYPSSMTAADFDGNGTADLAVTNGANGGNSVSVLLNNGDGTFASKIDYETGISPNSVTAADFNGDRKADLAVGNGSTVSVLLNTGNGTFAAKVDYGTAYFSVSVTAADFNGNGTADLAAANYGSSSVSVLLNNGDGTFAPKADYSAGSIPFSVTAADFNGDGKVDLAAANNVGNTVSVLLNNGDGTFDARTPFGTGSFPCSVTAADFNGDGKADLAVANESGTVSVLLNTTPGPVVQLIGFDFNTSHQGLRFTFSSDVSASLSADDLVLQNLTTMQSIPAANMLLSYDTVTNTATITFPGYSYGALPDGRYHTTLSPGSVTDALGNPLWASTFDFFVLGGDANHNARVDIGDLYALASNWQGNGRVFSQGDFNYDGKVDAADLGILARNWQKNFDGTVLSGAAMPTFLIPQPPPATLPPPPVRAPMRTRTPFKALSLIQ